MKLRNISTPIIFGIKIPDGRGQFIRRMGDSKRNVVFCDFIRRRFPKAKSVLVVADGKGELARKLANKGFKVRVVENKPRFEQ